MFSSLKLNSLKCQSNGDNDRKSDEEDGTVGDHTYEKLPLGGETRCECGTVQRSSTSRLNHHVSAAAGGGGGGGGAVRPKVATVNIERTDGTLGITLRGGFHDNKQLSKPVIITQVKPDGPAAREGTIKPGDRLLAVDGYSLQGSSLSDAQQLLQQQTPSTLLTIEYDVNVLDSVEHAYGPLLVEIEREVGQELGLTLFHTQAAVVVERVKTGSLADRCGALHVGDKILVVNNTRIEGTSLGLEDVEKLLESEDTVLRLEILPSHAIEPFSHYGTWRTRDGLLSSTCSMSGLSTLKPLVRNSLEHCTTGLYSSHVALTHVETLHTTICRENGSFGLEFMDLNGAVVISSVAPAGPAERCQCLHPGDRLLAVNHRSVLLNNLTALDIRDMLHPSLGDSKLILHTEYDVLDSVVPTSGTFTVRLAKRGSSGLGITITASQVSGFKVCEMRKGSIADRAGSLMPGDRLLAINGIPLDQCSVEYAAHALHQSPRVVTLEVQRDQARAPEVRNKRKVTYTVELQRYGGPLGITIAGSEELFQPITVSGLTPGGLAEQTGVLHVGDEIQAINNHDLQGEPLSKAHSLLHNSPDLVTLRVSRCIEEPVFRTSSSRSPMLPSSADSAVESWDSTCNVTPPPPEIKIQAEVNGTTEVTETLENPNLALFDEIANENLKLKHELELLSTEIEQQQAAVADGNQADGSYMTSLQEGSQQPAVEKDGAYNRESTVTEMEGCEVDPFIADTRDWFKAQYPGNEKPEGSVQSELSSARFYKVMLHKDPIYEDFGFSVSDGLYERGVFINRIRKGGPADMSGLLKSFDRILQVNSTYTQDFDCCLTVPLIAAAGDSLELLVARPDNNEVFDETGKVREQVISELGPVSADTTQRIAV